MAREKWIRPLFVLAAIYEGILGLAFLVWHARIFEFYEVVPPNHAAYVQFPALLLILFAIMFLRVASDPVRFRELMLYGVGLKASYTGLTFGYQVTQGIPSMWLPWAWADLAFLVLFVAAWRVTGRPNRAGPGGG